MALMRVPTFMVLAASALISSGFSAVAETPPNPTLARGEHVAQLVCSVCHVVAANQEFPPLLRQPGPTFVEIANREGMSEKTLRHFLTTTHWDEKTLPMAMPNPELTEEQSRAVARYILSLRRQ